VANAVRFAPNYGVLALAAVALSAAAGGPGDLLGCCAAATAALCAHADAFDYAWPHLHPRAVFDVRGAPLRVNGVAVKLTGHPVRNETHLHGLPKNGVCGTRRPAARRRSAGPHAGHGLTPRARAPQCWALCLASWRPAAWR
jgi:hypothetical protein